MGYACVVVRAASVGTASETSFRGRGLACAALLAIGFASGARPAAAADAAGCLVAAAREQVGVTVRYDPAYRRIPYPGGDVPADRGVCTDVLIRAYRRLGVDLQVLVHEDMLAAPSAYRKLWGSSRPDTSIDHRRVPNLVTFFGRHGEKLPVPPGAGGWDPGDIVTWRLPSGVPHIGIVSGRLSTGGVRLVIHNIGRGVQEEDVLLKYVVTGRFRYLPEPVAAACDGPR